MNTTNSYTLTPETEPVIKIDSALRTIHIPEELYEIGVAGDHYAETIYFRIPRIFDGTDLSTIPCVIEFVNALGGCGSTDAVNITADEKFITFGWEIDKRVTVAPGIIRFCVKFISTDDRGYQFTTTPAELKMKDGLLPGSDFTGAELSVLDDLKDRVSRLEVSLHELNNRLTAVAIRSGDNENHLQDLKARVNFLTDNVIYTSKILE